MDCLDRVPRERPLPSFWLWLLVLLGPLWGLMPACKGESRTPAPAQKPASHPAPPVAGQRGEAAAAPARPAGATAAGAGAVSCPGLEPVPTRYPAAARIVAIGDIHGDLAAARRALALAGAIDADDEDARWIGGDLVVVQTGDILDRGDDEQAILDLFERLSGEARAAGGAVHMLLGNHEVMNAAGDFRYVTPGGFADFLDVPGLELDQPELKRVPGPMRVRAAAFLPGGPYARLLARHNAVILVGDTVFVHGGVLPEWARYGLERLNTELRCWLSGATPAPAFLDATDNPQWSRHYSLAPEQCERLTTALEILGATRMVVGHTPQQRGISSACQGKVWRIDVGMAAAYGGPTQVLELRGSDTRVLE